MKETSSRKETLIGIAILAALALIAFGIFIKQSRYKPELYTAPAPKDEVEAIGASRVHKSPSQGIFSAKGMEPMTPPERFSADTLSDKIDGKAELYLSAGFESLETRRLKRTDKPDSWLEVFVYDMKNMRNAFSVFSMQRRNDARDLSLTQHAYRTDNALYFVHGQYYVEMIGSKPESMEEMLAMARDFVQQKSAKAESLDEMAAFPADHLIRGTVSLQASDVFGCESLNNVFSAKYLIEGEELRAFLSQRESPQKAEDLAASYHRFLLENGGRDIQAGLPIPGVILVGLFDLYEVIFSKGRFLAGVHEAENLDSARKLATMLYEELEAASQ